jgi:acyl-CoA reductase-like NAD-dependent aldehyde dehydrogenase
MTTTELRSLLNDPSLLAEKAYVDGQWVDGDNGTFQVVNPARGDVIANVADLSRAQVARAIAAAEAAQKDWAKWTGKERAGVMRRFFDLMMENQHDLGVILTRRAGQAAGRGQGRDRLWRVVHRVLRRGGQAHLWRDHPRPPARQAHHRHQAADRRRRIDHAVEFPDRDDHP